MANHHLSMPQELYDKVLKQRIGDESVQATIRRLLNKVV